VCEGQVQGHQRLGVDAKTAAAAACALTLTSLSKTGAHKKKEMKIKKMLDINDIDSMHDKREVNRESTCESSANRPDFQVTHENDELVTIYTEVDENQHKSIESTCELSRLNNLLTSFELQRHLCCAAVQSGSVYSKRVVV